VKRSPTPAEIVIMASGAVALIFSFFDYYHFDSFDGSAGFSAWSSGLFPLATYIAFIGVIMGVGVALTVFAGTQMPAQVVGFTIVQLHLALSFFAVLLSVGFLIVDNPGLGIGFWLMFIASIGLFVGSILEMKQGAPASPGAPPTA
jgi:hypothetical protein